MVKDKVQIRKILTLVSLSIAMGCPNGKYFFGVKGDVIESNEEAEKTQCKMSIVAFDGVSESTMFKAQEILNDLLSDKAKELLTAEDICVVCGKKSVYGFCGEKLKFDLKDTVEGDNVIRSSNVQMLINADEVETTLPALVLSFNSFCDVNVG